MAGRSLLYSWCQCAWVYVADLQAMFVEVSTFHVDIRIVRTKLYLTVEYTLHTLFYFVCGNNLWKGGVLSNSQRKPYYLKEFAVAPSEWGYEGMKVSSNMGCRSARVCVAWWDNNGHCAPGAAAAAATSSPHLSHPRKCSQISQFCSLLANRNK